RAPRGRASRDGAARALRIPHHGHGDPGGDGRRGGGALRGRARALLPEIRRFAGMEGFADEQQPLEEVRAQGGRVPDHRNRRLQEAKVGERRPPGPARAGDRGQRADPHVDRDGRGVARGGGGGRPDQAGGPGDHREPGERPGRPGGQHDRLGRPDPPQADGPHRPVRRRAVAAQEQGKGDDGAPLPAPETEGGRGEGEVCRGAPHPDRVRGQERADTDVQFPAEPDDGPSHWVIAPRPLADHGGRDRPAHRRPPEGAPPGAARRAGGPVLRAREAVRRARLRAFSRGHWRAPMLTVLEVVKKTSEFFASKGIESPRLNAELIVGHALGLPRMSLYIEFERPVGDAELGAVRELVRRRGRREPVQHILGFTEFCGLRLKTDRRALIPRPETELLVETITARCAAPPGSILDLGTGCGAIALALAKAFPLARVTAVDASTEALLLAAENAEATGLAGRVTFVESDWFKGLPAGERYDLIASNPPYLSADETAAAAPEVREH